MTTTFQVAGVIVPGRSALLYGVKNHPNKNLKGDSVYTSPVKHVTYDKRGLVLSIKTQNTAYFREDYRGQQSTESEASEEEVA